MSFVNALDDVAAALVTAGVRATTEPRNVTTPGAWVTLYEIRDDLLCGDETVRVSVHLVAADTGQSSYVRVLADLLDKARTAITVEEPITPDTVSLPTGGGPLPSLRLITTV